ncbi:MAG: hypothetical protein VB030_03220 [Eubacterium aggregans]|uniref:Uncharacterized protein n=1 Tax=Eubacterium aggregans TaxID=81409 RepID=A0A1H3YMN1_9FIRM|nr:hypothetical protein [Eubacterium aggregans]MDD4692612.1 hypothetical protein [Eubacterium aggregans]MEA5073163.1 hypothetical protein [Eubacterium aggregans]SEA12800.1 hypothetical protein SAMN04515656_10428 [Eubacterium aggregans]
MIRFMISYFICCGLLLWWLYVASKLTEAEEKAYREYKDCMN